MSEISQKPKKSKIAHKFFTTLHYSMLKLKITEKSEFRLNDGQKI